MHTFRSYHEPYLALQGVERRPPQKLWLHGDESPIELLSPEPQALDQLAQAVEALRVPDSALWKHVASESAAQGPVWRLAARLDDLGLVRERGDTLARVVDQEGASVRAAIARAHRWLSEELHDCADREVRLAPAQRLLDRAIAGCLVELGVPHGEPAHLSGSEPRSFSLEVWQRLTVIWSRRTPVTLAAARLALGALVGAEGQAPAEELLSLLLGGPHDVSRLPAQLDACMWFLAEHCLAGAPRRCSAERPAAPASGSSLILQAERCTRQWLASLGTSEFERVALGQRGESAQRVVRLGMYVEQYHLSSRIQLVFDPALRQELRPRLLDDLRAYRVEETGHEQHELETCVALGVPREAVVQSDALPPWTAYVELLEYMSEVDPLGLMLSGIITEGLPGCDNPMPRLLGEEAFGREASEAAQAHRDINSELDHVHRARALLAHTPSVHPVLQERALSNLGLMLELHQRALDATAAWYGASPELRFHQTFAFTARKAVP